MDPAEILFEVPSTIRVYKDGRVERFLVSNFTPPSLEPIAGVSSKDVSVPTAVGVSVRVYLPNLSTASPPQRLPLLVYFHGGAFSLGSAFDPLWHNYVADLTGEANAIAVSVNYRLVPEHTFSVPFDDSWAALKWVTSHADGTGTEDWLSKHADFERFYLAGDSAGANIAHEMAMRACYQQLDCGVRINGLLLLHPGFQGRDPVQSEMLDPEMNMFLRTMLNFACPSTAELEDPRLNPLASGAPPLSDLACKRVMVCVAGMDVLRDRGRAYVESLRGSGWGGEMELLESDGEGHGFHLYKGNCEKALEMKRQIIVFVNSNK